MKKTSRIATACVAGALATGMLTVPASAQSAYMEPTASATLPWRVLTPLTNGTPLEYPVDTATFFSAMPFMIAASLFSKQCHLSDVRGCHP